MNAGWPIRLRRCADELPGLLAAPGEQLRPEVWEGRAAQLRQAELVTARRRTAEAAIAAEEDAALLARRADDIDGDADAWRLDLLMREMEPVGTA